MNIEQEVIKKARGLVINQSRYIWPTKLFPDSICDAMYEVADQQTDEATAMFLVDKDIISDDSLLALVEKMGVAELYDGDGWVDYVADYIVNNKDDCMVMWNDIRALTEAQAK